MEILNIGANEKKPDPDFDLDGLEYTHIDDGYLLPHLGAGEWDGHIFISGATGSGKSWIINQIVVHDKKKRERVLFSDLSKPDDGTALFQPKIKDKSLKFDYEVYRPGMDLKNKICIFDDYKDIRLRDELLEKGRHTGTVVLCVTHKFRDYGRTKMPLNESKYIILFPYANSGVVKKEVKNYVSSNKSVDQIVDLAKYDGRYLIIHQHAPNMIITQRSMIRL